MSSQETSTLRRRKLPARYATIVSPLVLSLLMTFIVSLISTLKGVGVQPGLLRPGYQPGACHGLSLFRRFCWFCRWFAAS